MQSLPSMLYETGSLVSHCLLQPSWPMILWGFSCLRLPSHSRSTGTTDKCYHIWLWVGSRDPNSGALVCTTPTEPSPPPSLSILDQKVSWSILSFWILKYGSFSIIFPPAQLGTYGSGPRRRWARVTQGRADSQRSESPPRNGYLDSYPMKNNEISQYHMASLLTGAVVCPFLALP